MIETMLMTHSILVKAFLGFLVLGLFLPTMAKSPLGFKKASFIFTMVFQALITMIAFVGLIALIVGEIDFTFSTILMVVVFALMMVLEITKHKRIKKSNTEDEATLKSLRSSFLKINIINILILVAMVVFMILKAKGIISL